MNFLYLLIALFLVLPAGGESANSPADTVIGDIPQIWDYDYYERYGDSMSEFYYSGKVITNGQQALELACTVYYTTHPNSDKVPNYVTYYPQNGVYLVIFGRDYDPDDGRYVLGDCACVALDETDGRVISIFYEE